MDLLAAAQDADLDPYLVRKLNRMRRRARSNAVLLFIAIAGLLVVAYLLSASFAPDFLDVTLPTLDALSLIPEEMRISILFGSASPLVAAAGRSVDQIARARQERLMMLYIRYLNAVGRKEQAAKVLLTHSTRRGATESGELMEYLLLES